MQEPGRTIGQLAKAAGVGVETVRYYQRRGLLKQPLTPSTAGFRRYDEGALQLLRYIRMAQGFGLSLRDIEDLLRRSFDIDRSFCHAVQETVAAKLAKVRQELAALQQLEAELQICLASCAARDPRLPCPILMGLCRVPEAAGVA